MTLNIGDKYSIKRIITEEEVLLFSEVSGDKNPLHLDEEYAKKTRFKGRICHGMLIGAHISELLGMYFPGAGTIYLSQSLKFINPVYLGEEIDITAEVLEIVEKKVRLFIYVTNNNEKRVLEGEAIVLVEQY